MLSSSATFPRLHATILQDWLPQLGDKAFLAWLHFHSWTSDKIDQENSFLLPLSLNKIIKRLKTGKATFYEKVLRPLLHFGLISLQPASHSKQEMHMIVYASPVGQDFPEEQTLNSNLPQNSTTENVNPSPSPASGENPVQPDLPLSIEQAFSQDPQLIKNRSDIVYAYNQCKAHSQFNEEAFIRKLKTCMGYPTKNFGAYLLTSVRKEWDQSARPTSVFAPAITTFQPRIPSSSSHLPPWIVEQENGQNQSGPPFKVKLTPEQQAILDSLLSQM